MLKPLHPRALYCLASLPVLSVSWVHNVRKPASARLLTPHQHPKNLRSLLVAYLEAWASPVCVGPESSPTKVATSPVLHTRPNRLAQS